MLTYLRYTLAAVCFAASVGCLALWGWTISDERQGVIVRCISNISNQSDDKLMFYMEAQQGEAICTIYAQPFVERGWNVKSTQMSPESAARIRDRLSKFGLFFVAEPWVYFPLWYPALIFALAGVGVLRFRRQFSIRSAMICLTVVAALLGMAVVL